MRPVHLAVKTSKKPTEKSSSEGRDTGPGRGRGIACFMWNHGDYRFPACKYCHVCVRCSSDHRISVPPGERRQGPAGPSPDGGSLRHRVTWSSHLIFCVM